MYAVPNRDILLKVTRLTYEHAADIAKYGDMVRAKLWDIYNTKGLDTLP